VANKKTIKPFSEKDKYTQIHNYLLETLMPLLSGAEWKILCYFLRETKGWHEVQTEASYTDIKAGTGIKSDSTVAASVKTLLGQSDDPALAGKQILIRASESRWQTCTYRLNLDFEVEDNTTSIIEVAHFDYRSGTTSIIEEHPYIEIKEKENQVRPQTRRTSRRGTSSPKGRLPRTEIITSIRLPADFAITPEMRAWAERELPPETAARIDELQPGFMRKYREEYPNERRDGLAAWVAKWKTYMNTCASNAREKAERRGESFGGGAAGGEAYSASYDDLVRMGVVDDVPAHSPPAAAAGASPDGQKSF